MYLPFATLTLTRRCDPAANRTRRRTISRLHPNETTPRLHCTEDARVMARRRMPRLMFDFVDGAAGAETAARLNREALERIRLQPRVLAGAERRSVTKHLFGTAMGLPFGVAPMGMCDLTWPGADRMLAAEARRRRIPVCLSSAGSTTLEDMRALADKWAWFQLYVGQSTDAAFEMVDRAQAAGYEVLVLTVDVPQVAKRMRDLRNGFQVPFRIGPRQLLDFARHSRWSLETLRHGVPRTVNYDADRAGRGFTRHESRGRTDWAFLSRLRAHWQGKLVIKGVLSRDDAVRIRDTGADAVYVSNHGGRQLDSAPPAIHALPRIRAAVGDDFPLLFDSGVRNGEGIVKALALGADFVMLGRALLYAIGADGARGLATLMDLLAEEVEVTLAQLGRSSVEELDASALAEPPGEAVHTNDNRAALSAGTMQG